MSPDAVLAAVQRAVGVVLELPPTAVTRQARFRDDLAADSLALVEIVEIVQRDLAAQAGPGFHLDDQDLDALATVGDAVDYVVGRA